MAFEELPKHYDSAEVEARTTKRWLEDKAFAATPTPGQEPYVIMMPLPNVTGALHMGHAIDNTMQDMLVRFKRMQGFQSLWQPGTDHAGIATQSVVEKRLLAFEGKTRHDVGREALVQRIWDWKDEFQARIVGQQQSMGCGCDWDRQRFTMDAVCSRAVREAFFRFFQDKLIYRGDRLVNWDCHLRTAVADDEIETKDVQGHFWHLRYPIVDPGEGEPTHVIVATTRPETMLGDTAVACHPDPRGTLEARIAEQREKVEKAGAKDKEAAEAELARLEARMTEVVPALEQLRDMAAAGRTVMLPLQGREIPLIQDEWAKPELGSGCVKITPAHDPNDYEVWGRHQDHVDCINILNEDGTLNANAGDYKGLDRFEARDKVVADLDAQGLLARVEDRVIPIGHSDRSKTPIEPYLSKQWFVRMGDVEGGLVMGRGTEKQHETPGLAQAALDAVEGDWRSPTGMKLTFHPDAERYGNTYLNWLREKRDWCISRQLWWGHRIPIWHASMDGEALAAALAGLPEGRGEDYWVWVKDASGEPVSPEDAAGFSGEGPFDLEVCVRSEEAEAKPAIAALLASHGLERDPDVLDTWFSSALWPLSTLGWPDPATAPIDEGQTPLGAEGERPSAQDFFYPGSCLVTGRDIITLWVARMVIFGLYLEGDLPFYDCFVHANILDGKGEKMSKSKGNGIDPVDIIERYGADALRYVLCDMQTGMQDIRIPVQAVSPFTEKVLDLAETSHGQTLFTYICPDSGKEFDVLGTMDDLPRATIISDRFDAGKSFCTKLWNAARFAFMNLGEYAHQAIPDADLASEDRWILSRLDRCIAGVTAGLDSYNPSHSIAAARDFFWGDFCDWYLELIKERLKAGGESARVARGVLALVLDQVLRLMHPFIPFVTEELWARLNLQAPRRGLAEEVEAPASVLRAPWPQQVEGRRDEAIEADFATLQEVVRAVRELRSKYTVSPRERLHAVVKASGEVAACLGRLASHLQTQAGLSEVEVAEDPARPDLAAKAVTAGCEIYVAGVLDPVKERARLETQKKKLVTQVEKSEKKLGNERFVANAPEAVVATERQRLDEAKAELAKVEEGLAELG